MATVQSLARQFSALDLSTGASGPSKPTPVRPGHQKSVSQTSVSKMLAKFTPPASTPSRPPATARPSVAKGRTPAVSRPSAAKGATGATARPSAAKPVSRLSTLKQTTTANTVRPTITKVATPPTPAKATVGADIGKYDGGLESDEAAKPEEEVGSGAEELELDSSESRYASFHYSAYSEMLI
jgi:hypothetical protein